MKGSVTVTSILSNLPGWPDLTGSGWRYPSSRSWSQWRWPVCILLRYSSSRSYWIPSWTLGMTAEPQQGGQPQREKGKWLSWCRDVSQRPCRIQRDQERDRLWRSLAVRQWAQQLGRRLESSQDWTLHKKTMKSSEQNLAAQNIFTNRQD